MKINQPPTTAPKANQPEVKSAKEERNQALLTAARNFESLLVNQLISVMRGTVTKQGIVPESHAEKVYQSMLDQEYAQRIAETDQIGLGRMIQEQLLRASGGG